MAHHQYQELLEIVKPTPYEFELAVEVVLGALARAAEERRSTGADHTTNLIQQVTDRLAELPIEGLASIEGVEETAVRSAKGVGCTITAIANLEAKGDILPFGSVSVRDWPATTIPYNFQGHGSGYRVGDPFNYPVAEVYRLPYGAIATPSGESPARFLRSLPSSMGPKVRRVLREATDAFKSRTYLGVVVLLATASEAAWEQVAQRLSASGDAALAPALLDPNVSAARIQTLATAAIAARRLATRAELAALTSSARSYRDLRNHAVHEPEKSFDEGLFGRADAGTLLDGSVTYFRRLYDVHDRIV